MYDIIIFIGKYIIVQESSVLYDFCTYAFGGVLINDKKTVKIEKNRKKKKCF